MSSKERRFRIRWFLAVPLVIFILAFGGIFLAEYRVSAAIRKETDLLAAMGVDVRELSPKDNAAKDYEALFGNRNWMDGSTFPEETLKRLEKAAQKPYVRYEMDRSREDYNPFQISRPLANANSWCTMQSFMFAQRRDWKALERIFQIQRRLSVQYFAGGTDGTIATVGDGLAPLDSLSSHPDPQIRSWLRRKLETFEYRDLLKARLSAMGRYARRLKGEPITLRGMHTVKEPAWWEKAIEKTTLFQKGAQLAVLREWRKIVEGTLKQPFPKALMGDKYAELALALKQDGSWPATWASQHIEAFGNEGLDARQLHIALIRIDLQEAKEKGKPLVPTWSKKYCVDPETGAPIKIKATANTLQLSSTSPTGTWTSGSSW